MNWLIHNPIADMYGPDFLMFYGTVIIVIVIACKFASTWVERSKDLPPLLPSQPDPYEIAYLRGGTNEVTRLAIFDLIQRGYLEMNEAPGKREQRIMQAPEQSGRQLRSDIERFVFEWFAASHTVSDVFQTGGLAAQLEAYCTPYERRLQEEHLLTSSEGKQVTLKAQQVGTLIILGLGAYKLLVALSNGRTNVGFLIILGIIGVVALWLFGGVPRLTNRGSKYLRELQLAFDRLKAPAGTYSSGEPVSHLPLLVGLYGVTVLSGTAFDFYPKTFRQGASSSSGGGCGGGCGGGGGGGGDGGGGDGGGGCGGGGGGGCGGCGGG